jgi:prolyl-tRNA editing enzyme YbaK/EbsC (Cys-tRNA(Pro) deacylase)
MENNLSKSAKIVQEALQAVGLTIAVIELSSSSRTAQEAANTLDCQLAEIIKSILFCTKKTRTPILVLASGVNRVNEKIIEKLVNDKIVKADADFTREITGFVIGGVAPIGHKQPIENIYIDEDLLKFETLWVAAGTPNAVFSLPAEILPKLTGGKIVAIK